MSDGRPRSSRNVAEQLHFTDRAAESVCYRSWKAGLLLRSIRPIRERNRTLAGRSGSRYNTRSYYLFVLHNGSDEAELESLKFLSFSGTPRIARPNKSQLILSFLRENVDKAFYTSEIAKLLRDQAGNNLYYNTNSITLGGGESLDVILDASDTASYPAGSVFYLYTPNLDHLSNDAENFGGLMTEVHIN